MLSSFALARVGRAADIHHYCRGRRPLPTPGRGTVVSTELRLDQGSGGEAESASRPRFGWRRDLPEGNALQPKVEQRGLAQYLHPLAVRWQPSVEDSQHVGERAAQYYGGFFVPAAP